MKKRHFIRVSVLLLALITLCMLFASCSKSANDYAESVPSKPQAGEMGSAGFDDTVMSNTSDLTAEQRKIIKTYNVQAETKDFDAAIKLLSEMVTSAGGYVEKSSTTNKSMNNSGSFARYASYTVRIPAENADAFVGSLGTLFNVTSSDAQVEDISETYYGIEARLEELRVERDSLLDILDQTETKKDYNLWLTVKQRLSEVTQQIAVYQGQINRYDSKVAYSTVTLSIREVLTFSESGGNTFASRLGASLRNGWSGFFSFLQSFTVWLAGAMPVLLLLAANAVIVILIIRRAKRKGRERREKQKEE